MENRRNRPQNDQPPVARERRKKNDWVTYMATILSIVSWAVAFVVWAVLDMASPEKEHLFTRMFNVEVRSYWDTSLLPIAFILLILSLCTCIAAFIFNVLRKRRKTDKYKKSIFIAAGITIIGIVIFILRFGGELIV